jgi:MFS family permease
MQPTPARHLATSYLRWACLRSAFARGYWQVTAVYLVTVAGLSPAQLVLIGTFQGITVVLAEVPCGVLADAVSRRLSLVIGHVVMGTGMAMAGLVTSFPLLVVSQCLWGLGWAFSSGADVAWLTDELGSHATVDGTLVRQARWSLVGTPIGIVSFALLAWASTLSTAIVVAGIAMVLLGAVVARWPESGFTPAEAGRRWRASTSIFRRATQLARADGVVLVVLTATFLVNGGLTFGRLTEARLVGLGMPTHPDPVVWFAAISLVGAAMGGVALRAVEARIHGVDSAQRSYVAACAVGVVGLLVFACAPNTASAVAGVLLVSGTAEPVLRAAGVVWLNRRTTSDMRATVHSLLSQAENVGEIVFGLALAVVAGVGSATAAIIAAAVLFAVTTVLVGRPIRDSAIPVSATRTVRG